MPNYRRLYIPGGTFFFTLVTHGRGPLFSQECWRTALRHALETIQSNRPFTIEAFVLLPDHLHCIWTLPPCDADYSNRWRRIKEEFTNAFLENDGKELEVSKSRSDRSERGVWQRRFWEHACRDQDDMNRCLDYTHWNPVKHGLVTRVRDWPYSSFHRYVKIGAYPIDWGAANPCPGYDAPEWE